HDQQSDNGR
ncbi:hypothetical protein D039_0865B, partial [Vibrio parahaemolyticus EKP-028]